MIPRDLAPPGELWHSTKLGLSVASPASAVVGRRQQSTANRTK